MNYLDKIKHLDSKGSEERAVPRLPEPIAIDPAAGTATPTELEEVIDIHHLGPPQRDWLEAWRYVASLSAGLIATDPRLPGVMNALDRCDDGFRSEDWEAFDEGVAQLRAALHPEPQPPVQPCFTCKSTIWWVSVHGAVVCRLCHPPASPELVARWINCTQPTERTDPSPIQPGDTISWQRANGITGEGFVDFVHTDPHGQQWAFVSFGEMWAAVNPKFAKVQP